MMIAPLTNSTSKNGAWTTLATKGASGPLSSRRSTSSPMMRVWSLDGATIICRVGLPCASPTTAR